MWIVHPEVIGDIPPSRIAAARPDRPAASHLPTVAPDPSPGEVGSRFDVDQGIVSFNDLPGDYLMVKVSESMLLDYLATLGR